MEAAVVVLVSEASLNLEQPIEIDSRFVICAEQILEVRTHTVGEVEGQMDEPALVVCSNDLESPAQVPLVLGDLVGLEREACFYELFAVLPKCRIEMLYERLEVAREWREIGQHWSRPAVGLDADVWRR